MNIFINSSDDILAMKPTRDDLVEGARYAAITLPWTFNRMMFNTGSIGQQQRALNIAKGIVAQEMLKRRLSEIGISASTQRKSHRDNDLFDFRVQANEHTMKLDLKSWNYYSNYTPLGREPLTSQIIIDNRNYPGPDWRRFFPMLVPHTQILQDKEAYCFAISKSIDFRNDHISERSAFAMTAFPFGPLLPFLSSRQLCQIREEEGKGIHLSATLSQSMSCSQSISIKILGEWAGEQINYPINLTPGKNVVVGPFSCVSSFQIGKDEYDKWFSGTIQVSVTKNELKKPVLNSTKKNVNITTTSSQILLGSSDFCNLILPDNYELFVIGWIGKQDYLDRCKQYMGWVWPNNRLNKFENQLWSQITESDLSSLKRAGFEGCIQRNPTILKAGWIKTTGRGGGACCYVYPNIGAAQGGVKETNLYVLPKDLHPMSSLSVERL